MISGWTQPGWIARNRSQLLGALQFWIDSEELKRWEPLRKPSASQLFWTDASLEGWGCHAEDGQSIYGDWRGSPLCGSHINLLEIAAVENLIKSDLVGVDSSIKVYTDNKTAFYAINNQGSSKSPKVTQAFGRVRVWLKRKNINIEMIRVPGKFNVLADSLSRGTVISSEWELNDVDFNWILKAMPQLEIDMFATPFNAKLPKFVSPFDHPRALAVNAFMVKWSRWSHLYLFPPEAALSRVVSQLEDFRGSVGEIHHFLAFIPYSVR